MNSKPNPIISASCGQTHAFLDREDGSFDYLRYERPVESVQPENHHKLATKLGFLSPSAVFIEFSDGSFDVAIQRREMPKLAYPKGRYSNTQHRAA